MARVFVTGGTGYIGRPLIRALIERGHMVRALVREGSQHKLPPGCEAVIGNALDGETFAPLVSPGDIFLQLVGTPHPSPAKAAEFERVDFVSARESVKVAQAPGAGHFVYLSAAHPAPVMRAYINVRSRGETIIRDASLIATCLRPWYVLGPGHRWAAALKPLYWVWEQVPATRETARRLGLVRLEEMISAIAYAIDFPPIAGVRVIDVPGIRRCAVA